MCTTYYRRGSGCVPSPSVLALCTVEPRRVSTWSSPAICRAGIEVIARSRAVLLGLSPSSPRPLARLWNTRCGIARPFAAPGVSRSLSTLSERTARREPSSRSRSAVMPGGSGPRGAIDAEYGAMRTRTAPLATPVSGSHKSRTPPSSRRLVSTSATPSASSPPLRRSEQTRTVRTAAVAWKPPNKCEQLRLLAPPHSSQARPHCGSVVSYSVSERTACGPSLTSANGLHAPRGPSAGERSRASSSSTSSTSPSTHPSTGSVWLLPAPMCRPGREDKPALWQTSRARGMQSPSPVVAVASLATSAASAVLDSASWRALIIPATPREECRRTDRASKASRARATRSSLAAPETSSRVSCSALSHDRPCCRPPARKYHSRRCLCSEMTWGAAQSRPAARHGQPSASSRTSSVGSSRIAPWQRRPNCPAASRDKLAGEVSTWLTATHFSSAFSHAAPTTLSAREGVAAELISSL
mmetsp:Transcript_34197/g.107494  ORF Transcript_34197/g.107494 Transcript_34197/m.107494 type:complete len:471 (+) Transcript_34197:81-1493(+)